MRTETERADQVELAKNSGRSETWAAIHLAACRAAKRRLPDSDVITVANMIAAAGEEAVQIALERHHEYILHVLDRLCELAPNEEQLGAREPWKPQSREEPQPGDETRSHRPPGPTLVPEQPGDTMR